MFYLFFFFKELIEPPNFNLDKNKAQEKRSEIANEQGNIWSRTYMLQLFCNSETDKLDGAFWVAAWYFWAAAPSWLTWEAKITTIKYTQYPIVAKILNAPTHTFQQSTFWHQYWTTIFD